MKASLLITILISIFSASFSVNADTVRKQRPFNDEGPICKENCGGSKDEEAKEEPTFNFKELFAESNEPKPPFNDEGPGGNKG